MFTLFCSLIRLLVLPGRVREIAMENLALRQPLTVFKRQCPRPRLNKADRLFWVLLCKAWKDWRRALIIVKPETLVSWHRKGFRLFWTWISRRQASTSFSNLEDLSRQPRQRAGVGRLLYRAHRDLSGSFR